MISSSTAAPIAANAGDSSVTGTGTASEATPSGLPSMLTLDLSFDSIFESAGLSTFSTSLVPPAPVTTADVALTAAAPVTAIVTGEISENARFLASLAFDLRMDVLLSADAAFLQSLPATAQAEARAIRNAHNVQAGRVSAMAGLMGRDGADLFGGLALREPSISRYGRSPSESSLLQVPSFAASSSSASRRHERERTALAMLQSASRPTPTDSEAAEAQKAISTSYFLTDDRIVPSKELPFGVPLVVCLFGCMLGVTKVRGPRPLLRLLATTCRYRGTRPWVLRSLMAVLTRDPAQFVHSMGHVLGDGDRDLSDSVRKDILALSKRITNSSSSSSSSDVMSSSVEMRRFLSLLSYVMKKTDKLVWYDMLTIKYYGRPTSGSRTGMSSNQVSELTELEGEMDKGNGNDEEKDEEKIPCLKSKKKDSNPDERWLFGSLLGLLKDPAVLTSSPTLDTTLHVIELMCDPLGHLTAKEANALAGDQIKKLVPYLSLL